MICSLLFADEIGVPLPFAPNELMLIFAGVLIATGALSPWEFVPIALVAMYAGSFLGYSWARQVGELALARFAGRVRAEAGFTRAVARMQRAGLGAIIITRLIPAVRTQATLAAGAIGVDRRLFLSANAIAIAIWLGGLVTVGWLIGIPAERYLSRAFTLLLSGGVLVVLGFAAYYIARRRSRLPSDATPTIQRVPRGVRLGLAIALDVGLIAVLVAGLERIARFVALISAVHLRLPLVPDGIYDLLVITGVAAVGYLLVARLSLRATVGERLFAVHYRRLRSERVSTA